MTQVATKTKQAPSDLEKKLEPTSKNLFLVNLGTDNDPIFEIRDTYNHNIKPSQKPFELRVKIEPVGNYSYRLIKASSPYNIPQSLNGQATYHNFDQAEAHALDALKNIMHDRLRTPLDDFQSNILYNMTHDRPMSEA